MVYEDLEYLFEKVSAKGQKCSVETLGLVRSIA
jgi:hypothetical protein